MSGALQTLNKISLRGDHLLFTPNQVASFFGRVSHVYVSTDTEFKRINMCSVAHPWFTKVHKDAAQMMLKQKSIEGTKALNIRSFLIDLEIDEYESQDLALAFSEKTGLIQIDFQ